MRLLLLYKNCFSVNKKKIASRSVFLIRTVVFSAAKKRNCLSVEFRFARREKSEIFLGGE